MKQRNLFMIIAALLLLAAVTPTLAFQGESPPDEIDVALTALQVRTDETISFETLAGFQWEARTFSDSSLGCPVPGEVYAQAQTPGYQFTLTYAGTTYDYRVAENADDATLCDTYPAEQAQPSPTPDGVTGDCGAYYEVQPDDVLFQVAQACGTTVEALMNINPDIEDPALIYTGQRLAIPTDDSPYNVSITPDSGIPGTTITITASGFPAGARVEYGLGRFRSEYDIYGTREVGSSGVLTTTATVPEGADSGEEWVAVAVYDNTEATSEVFEVTSAPLFDTTQIYLVALGDDGRSGDAIGCSDSLVPVTIDIQPTVAPLTAALNNLLEIDSRTYGQSGLYSALYQSDLEVEGIDIEDGTATINLTGEVTVGGACDVPRVIQQLRRTALQYNTVDTVEVSVDGQPLADVLS